jgi:hypothetical protein
VRSYLSLPGKQQCFPATRLREGLSGILHAAVWPDTCSYGGAYLKPSAQGWWADIGTEPIEEHSGSAGVIRIIRRPAGWASHSARISMVDLISVIAIDATVAEGRGAAGDHPGPGAAGDNGQPVRRQGSGWAGQARGQPASGRVRLSPSKSSVRGL